MRPGHAVPPITRLSSRWSKGCPREFDPAVRMGAQILAAGLILC